MAEQFTKFITNAQTKMGNYRRLSLLRFRQLCLACVGLHLVVRKLSSRRQNCSAGTDYEKSPFWILINAYPKMRNATFLRFAPAEN